MATLQEGATPEKTALDGSALQPYIDPVQLFFDYRKNYMEMTPVVWAS
jgi:hypothetical protein